MSYRKWTSSFIFLVMVSSASSAGQVGGQFQITKSTLDAGGGQATGGQYILTGTIGQPDAGVQPQTGGGFQLRGGFWPKGKVQPREGIIFMDSFEEPL